MCIVRWVSTFVLVHGAWHDGSCWDGVVKRLNLRGHNAFAPTMGGRGAGVATRITHAELCQPIVDFIVGQNVYDFVLVGHSYGGTVVSKVVEQVSDRVRRLVYVNAFVLSDGESLNDVAPPPYRQLFKDAAAASTDNTVRLPFDIWRDAFINDGDEDLVRSTYQRLWPEPYQPLMEPLSLEKFYSLAIPKSYLLGREDVALPEGEQWGWRPRFTDRLGEHRFLEVRGSHEGLLTNPDDLADSLIEAARD
jgi:pimeloyl-ACP methyl ester carboxylesterase